MMFVRWQIAAAACGLVLAPLGARAQTAAPRYQTPFGASTTGAPNAPRPTAITQNGVVVEDVIVRVNDQIINRSDYERGDAQLQQELQQTNASAAEREEKQKDLLRDMIDQQLLLSKGKELGLNGDAEVVRRLDEIRKQNHLDTMEDLEKAARQQGVNFEDFKANIRNGVITQQVVRDEVGRRLQMTQTQEQAFYDAHKSEFAQPEQVRLSEILVPAPAEDTEAQLTQAKAKADGIVEKLKGGANFVDLAKANSGGQTAAQGGDLGLYKRGAMAAVFEDQTLTLPVGGVTTPIRTKQGFVILKVTEHQQAGVPPLKEIEPQIQEAMYSQEMAPKLREYLTKLREDSSVDVAPGFVDSGASAKQTKFVFTAYATPTPKKKTQAQKARFDRGGSGSGSGSSAPAAKGGLAALPSGTGPALVPDAMGHVASSTASDATATVAAPASVASGKVRTTARVSGSGKVKKIRREKVRFGQAPRNALPAGPEEQAQVGSDTGSGAQSAAVTPGGVMDRGATPGSAIAPTESTSQVASSVDADPLARRPVDTGKTRFSARDAEFRAQKAATKQAKVKEKVVATPVGPDKQETTTAKVQAAPLGLNGDTVKKKKKVKVKGGAKERLQEKKPDTTPAAPIAPTVNPALATAPGGAAATPAANSNDRQTTLPAKDAPVPGAPPQGQPLPPDGTPQTTPNGTPAPQPQS